MQELRVDPYGIEIMLPKTIPCLIKLDAISNIAANILKQEMLSSGGDVAVARGALTGKTKTTGCLLIGSLAQLKRLNQKLKAQPFGLSELSKKLECALKNDQRESFTIDLGKSKLSLGPGKTRIMGILNMTPDSFSRDGLYRTPTATIAAYAQQLVKDGADIIDVGGESSRPGSKPVSVRQELTRTIPVIKMLVKKCGIPISIDTYKPEVAQQAIEKGAVIVNDITGLRNKKMAKLIARKKAAVVIMHMKGTPRTMQKNPAYVSLLDELITFFEGAIARAQNAGIAKDKIIIDPGIGFGKTSEDNLTILRTLGDLKVLGVPLLVGTSRKSFPGIILNAPPGERIFGTVASTLIAAHNGAHIVRVHDVKEIQQSLKVCNAIQNR